MKIIFTLDGDEQPDKVIRLSLYKTSYGNIQLLAKDMCDTEHVIGIFDLSTEEFFPVERGCKLAGFKLNRSYLLDVKGKEDKEL